MHHNDRNNIIPWIFVYRGGSRKLGRGGGATARGTCVKDELGERSEPMLLGGPGLL